MAALARRVVKITVLSVGAVPVIGLAGTVSAASTDDSEIGKRQLIRACDLPVYEIAKNKKDENKEKVEVYEPNAIERQITSIRKAVQDLLETFRGTYESVKSNVDTGIDHTKTSLDYIQTTPGELPRVAFISIVTMGGFVIGHRGGIMRKVIFTGIAAASSTALCYPNQTVQLTRDLTDEAKHLWKENIGWPLDDASSDRKEASLDKSKKPPKEVKGDPGQSNSEDKDMYNRTVNIEEEEALPNSDKDALFIPNERPFRIVDHRFRRNE